MRAAGWSINRDVVAAKTNWQPDSDTADQLDADDPLRLAMRIAPGPCCVGTLGAPVADVSPRLHSANYANSPAPPATRCPSRSA